LVYLSQTVLEELRLKRICLFHFQNIQNGRWIVQGAP